MKPTGNYLMAKEKKKKECTSQIQRKRISDFISKNATNPQFCTYCDKIPKWFMGGMQQGCLRSSHRCPTSGGGLAKKPLRQPTTAPQPHLHCLEASALQASLRISFQHLFLLVIVQLEKLLMEEDAPTKDNTFSSRRQFIRRLFLAITSPGSLAWLSETIPVIVWSQEPELRQLWPRWGQEIAVGPLMNPPL